MSNHPDVIELAREVRPYLAPLGYTPPPTALVRSWQDRWPRETTTTREYCIAAVQHPDDRTITTLCTILDTANSHLSSSYLP